jgi:hypothetical protein
MAGPPMPSALRTLYAYERGTDRALVLGAGLAPEWLMGAGVRVSKMPTLYGSLSFSLRSLDRDKLRLEIPGGVAAKMILRPPLSGPLRSVTVNGAPYAGFDEHSVTIADTPAEVICSTSDAQ